MTYYKVFSLYWNTVVGLMTLSSFPQLTASRPARPPTVPSASTYWFVQACWPMATWRAPRRMPHKSGAQGVPCPSWTRRQRRVDNVATWQIPCAASAHSNHQIKGLQHSIYLWLMQVVYAYFFEHPLSNNWLYVWWAPEHVQCIGHQKGLPGTVHFHLVLVLRVFLRVWWTLCRPLLVSYMRSSWVPHTAPGMKPRSCGNHRFPARFPKEFDFWWAFYMYFFWCP